MSDYREKAKQLMKGYCRVCRVCDGRACAGEVPGMGGAGTGSAFYANVDSLAAKKLNMKLIHEVIEPDTSTSLLGLPMAMPVLAAPIGGVSFNMGGGMSEEDYASAVVTGCAESGLAGCTGDGVPDEIHQSGFSAIRAAGGRGIPFIKPWDDEELFTKIRNAEDTGAPGIGMDIDAAGLITLRAMGRPVSPKGPDHLKRVRDVVKGRFILKGLMTVEDALAAAEAGVDAIVVSNHGGRVLDSTPGTSVVLPGIAEVVGRRMEILVDGGVRSGGDVLKMLALGADGVMIGRPISVAAVGGGLEGVKSYLAALQLQLKQAMVLTGTPSSADVSPAILC